MSLERKHGKMEKYLVPLKPSIERLQPLRRWHWKRSEIELNGRFAPNYCHEMLNLLLRSDSEVGAFPHLYQVDWLQCQSHMNRIVGEANGDCHLSYRRQGISALDFDNKGIYLVSLTKSGLKEDESKHLMHLSLNRQLDAVKWNPLNQDEVVCMAVKSNELLIFEVGYVSSEPVELNFHSHLSFLVKSCLHSHYVASSFKNHSMFLVDC